ncbi:response regulator [Thermodesulfobacteriota bacterium]
MDLNMRILVVDDFATTRRIIKGTLKQLGMTNVAEADDGSSALEELRKEKADLILCDCNMPNMSGLELLKVVRSDEKLKDTPFIMLPSEEKREEVIEMVKSGVNDYIIKPFAPDTLKNRIEKVCG